MGHYLDLLLPINVQDEGEALPVRGVLNFVGFDVSDDGTAITIEADEGGGGGGEVVLAGNVVGATDDNRVAFIAGDAETQAVGISCATFHVRHTVAHNQSLPASCTLAYVLTGESEVNVLLPNPTESDGRVFTVVVTGVGTISLRRFASEQINGVGSHLTGIAGPCIMIIVGNGTDWTAARAELA